MRNAAVLPVPVCAPVLASTASATGAKAVDAAKAPAATMAASLPPARPPAFPAFLTLLSSLIFKSSLLALCPAGRGAPRPLPHPASTISTSTETGLPWSAPSAPTA